MKHRLLTTVVLAVACAATATAQSLNARRHLEKANKETLPTAVKSIEDNTSAKVALELDAASFGEDEKAWGNLYIVANRIVGAFGEVGKDQLGKDALAKNVKKIAIMKISGDGKEDAVELKDGTLTVKTAATDNAVSLLQGVIVAALEKAL